jgi:hypothetical protein
MVLQKNRHFVEAAVRRRYRMKEASDAHINKFVVSGLPEYHHGEEMVSLWWKVKPQSLREELVRACCWACLCALDSTCYRHWEKSRMLGNLQST